MALTAVYDSRSGTAPDRESNAAPDEREHDEMSTPTADPFRRDGAETVEPMSPTTDTDVSRIKFPIGTVAAIVGTAIGVVTAQQLGQAQLKSDVRDILTRMEYQQKVEEADKRAQDLIFETMKQSVDQLRGQVQLLQLQYGEMSKQMQARR